MLPNRPVSVYMRCASVEQASVNAPQPVSARTLSKNQRSSNANGTNESSMTKSPEISINDNLKYNCSFWTGVPMLLLFSISVFTSTNLDINPDFYLNLSERIIQMSMRYFTHAVTALLSIIGFCSVSADKPHDVNFRFYPYELRLKHSFNLSAMSRTTTPGVQVEISIDSLTGYGEASMPPYLGESVESVMSFLSQIDSERLSDPFALEEIHAYMDSIADGNRAAKAAVDIALHDLIGKMMSQPWYRIYGLDAGKAPCTSFTISNDTPEELERKLAESEPYGIIKVKMGVPGDRELIEWIRSRTDKPICVDVNQGWKSREEALENILWLSERNTLFVEQPMDKTDSESHAWLKSHSPLPIIADEAVQTSADIPAIARSYDGVNIKLMKSGGMHEAYKMAVLAKSLGMKVMIGCMTETSCAVSAAAQLAPLADWVDLDGNLLIANDLFDGMKIVDGRVTLSQHPGIGVRKLNESAIQCK